MKQSKQKHLLGRACVDLFQCVSPLRSSQSQKVVLTFASLLSVWIGLHWSPRAHVKIKISFTMYRNVISCIKTRQSLSKWKLLNCQSKKLYHNGSAYYGYRPKPEQVERSMQISRQTIKKSPNNSVIQWFVQSVNENFQCLHVRELKIDLRAKQKHASDDFYDAVSW